MKLELRTVGWICRSCGLLILIARMEQPAIDMMDLVAVSVEETIEKAGLVRLALASSFGKKRWSACSVAVVWFDRRRKGREDFLKMFLVKS